MSGIRIFSEAGSVPWFEVAPGSKRRVLVHTEELMQVEFAFDTGAIGALHSHPHVQASYIAEGRFEVTVGGKVQVLGPGGSFIVPSNVEHGVKALEAGRLIDTFAPMRKDFL